SLTYPQTLSPIPQVYFLSYDIGEAAYTDDLLGAKIGAVTSIGVAQPKTVNSIINVGITRLSPFGSKTQEFPFETIRVPINAVSLKIKANSLAPAGVKPGMTTVPLLSLTLSVSRNYIDIGAMRIDQTGTVDNPGRTEMESLDKVEGRGDINRLSIYLDADGNQVFTTAGDQLVGTVRYWADASSVTVNNDFKGGRAVIDFNIEGKPRLRVTSQPSLLYIVGDIAAYDNAGCPTIGVQAAGGGLNNCLALGHQIGVRIDSLADLMVPGRSASITVVEDPYDKLPANSGLTLISPDIIPAVSLIPAIMYAPDGYPAYAKLDSSGTAIRINGKLQADLDRRTIVGGEPLIELDGDEKPDNFDFNRDNRRMEIDLEPHHQYSKIRSGFGL
ncbi:MAG: hypothetical protein HY747_02725, partial [Elusimicrobia bacterium]|nr:hypothetical protein [Elusimicrobiota bacterium]